MDKRLTYRTKKGYNTRSNRQRIVKTPGGRLVYQKLQKRAKGPICGDTKKPIQGVAHLNSWKYKQIKKCKRTVARAYGGTVCASAVRERILRAFLSDEQKSVRSLTQAKAKKEEKAKARAAAKKAAPKAKGAKKEGKKAGKR